MIYFERAGRKNTDAVVEAAVKRAKELGITHIVVATNTGATAKKFLGKGFQVVCVTHHVGFKEPGHDEMSPETRKELQERGAAVLTTTHLLAGVDRALRLKFQGLYPAELMAATLKMFGQGVKVCVEIAPMALDAGLIPYGEEVVAVGGTGGGADTACVLVPDHARNFFDTQVKEIICKPR